MLEKSFIAMIQVQGKPKHMYVTAPSIKLSIMIGMGLCLVNSIGRQKHCMDPTLDSQIVRIIKTGPCQPNWPLHIQCDSLLYGYYWMKSQSYLIINLSMTALMEKHENATSFENITHDGCRKCNVVSGQSFFW